ncbi:coenzyme Q-binding protein COQ10 [Geosmithia morbida]|uniref:Coenzyme Q-binding protein COQ10 n=1 Tax=Geosmithia morbida TaxID=1094350 RepID=A0A9P4YQX3_9HYPO|nr:coenzyme Q-binding protein COQ10 [Geosmithia morbida]KAF4120172.1 coenzyme Q-binding protein COQ10 [Geosmithia morbida]
MATRTARRICPARLRGTTRLGLSPCPARGRPFFSLPSSATAQHLTATRILPYALDPVYDLIADVDSYSTFLPYCSSSPVTAWSPPDSKTGRRWPVRADLHVGWGGFDEVFSSRLHCIPGQSVEAVSGDGDRDSSSSKTGSAVFTSLVTRWSVRALQGGTTSPSPRTQVHLDIRYQFTNPLYAAVSAAVSDKVASLMIEAFEKRAREKLGGRL